jgi:transposase
LPLNLDYVLDENDEVFSFLKAIGGIDFTKYLKKSETRGRKGHDNVRMLKAVLFAYMQNGRPSLRKMEDLCAHDVRYIWLTEEGKPSFMAFERLLANHLIRDIEEIYYEITMHLVDEMGVSTENMYIDGTKVEAYANKNSFVYKRSILNRMERMFFNVTRDIISLNAEFGYDFRYGGDYCAQEIGYIATYLSEVIARQEIAIKYGKGKRKHSLQRHMDKFIDYYARQSDYEYWLGIIGSERRSCSKTDHDATMCCTKMDYYCNTGLTRPCYNLQIGVSDGLIVNAGLFQRPGDVKTFIPFMERYREHTGSLPLNPMADAAYGNMENYLYCCASGMNPVMKYANHARKNTARFRKKKFEPLNWDTDERGFRICPDGRVLDEHVRDFHRDTGGTLQISQVYRDKAKCQGCPMREECLSTVKRSEINEESYRTTSRNVVSEELHRYVDATLSSEFGKGLKKQRSIMAEGAFGVLKEDFGFTRFTRRGLQNAEMEFLLVCLGYNLKKFHHWLMAKRKSAVTKPAN